MISKRKYYSLFSLVSIKFVSLFLMAYVLLYLSYFGGLNSVGVFSAITAVTGPLAMFASFRYVEWMALHGDKNYAFSISISAAIFIYFILALFAYFILIKIDCDLVVLLLLVTYKPFEMIGEFYASSLISKGDVNGAVLSVVSRLILIIIFSLLGLLYKFGSVLLIIAASLIVSHIFVLALNDFPKIIRKRHFVVITVHDILGYISNNFKYGLLSAIISFNSSLPRYFLTYIGDMEILGLFSMIYLVAATAVNILQYPVSVKIVQIRDYLIGNLYLIRLVFLIQSVVLLFLLILSGAPYLNIHDWRSYSNINLILLFVSISFMFVFLMFRGILFSLSIALNLASNLQWLTLCSSILAVFVLSGLRFFEHVDSNLIISCLFVSMSSYFSSIIVIYKLKMFGYRV